MNNEGKRKKKKMKTKQGKEEEKKKKNAAAVCCFANCRMMFDQKLNFFFVCLCVFLCVDERRGAFSACKYF